MFAAQHDNPPSLRQGDIVSNVFFPLARPAFQRYLATYDSGLETAVKLQPFVETPKGSIKKYVQSTCHGVVAYAAVISQCCDLDKNHPKPSFSLCRLIPYDRAKYKNPDALVNNTDPWGAENPHFQFFYLGKIEGLGGEYLADYGWLTTLSWADYEFILGKKVQQLDDLNR